MAEIISFQARPRSDRISDSAPAGGAKLLFFTGVRYMRISDEAPAEPTRRRKPSRSGKPRRKRA